MIYVHHVPQIDAADKLSELGFQHVLDGPAWTRTRDQRIMSPLL
jgi:hypothetical protein